MDANYFLKTKVFNKYIKDKSRIGALLHIAKTNTREAFFLSLDLFGDNSAYIRNRAVSMAKICLFRLKECDYEDAINALQTLLGSNNSYVRRNAVEVLSFAVNPVRMAGLSNGVNMTF